MNQTDKGILIFYEWMNAMESLPPKSYKALMTAICNFQQKGEEPPEFQGYSAALASIIFPFLRRRRERSRAGKMGMYARYGLDEESIRLQEFIQQKLQENQQ